jgi:acetyl esterase/lipase
VDFQKIHPELRDAMKRAPNLPLHNRLFLTLAKGLMRILPVPKAGPGVTIENRHLHNAGVRIYKPAGGGNGAGLLWIHGGGLIIGRAADDRVCGALVRDLGLTVVSVEYRLAPRHPYPAAIDDCFEAWQWLQQSARELGIDPARIAVGGQSAGGGLAAALAQRILDSGGVQPAAQILFCPMIDDRTALRSELDANDYLMWNARNNRQAWSWYLGQPAGAPGVPPYAAAARREQLAGLPPAWISTGDIELFYDEDRLYAERLLAAGVLCQLHVVPGAPHGFEVFATDAALTREMFLSAYRFLGAQLGFSVDPARYSYGSRPDGRKPG